MTNNLHLVADFKRVFSKKFTHVEIVTNITAYILTVDFIYQGLKYHVEYSIAAVDEHVFKGGSIDEFAELQLNSVLQLEYFSTLKN